MSGQVKKKIQFCIINPLLFQAYRNIILSASLAALFSVSHAYWVLSYVFLEYLHALFHMAAWTMVFF